MELKEFDFNNLEIKTDIHESEFLKEFLKEEFLHILKNEELKNNNLYFNKSYVYEDKEYIELGVYITNTSEKNVLLKEIPLTIINGNKKIKKVLSIYREIEKKKSIFKELKIEKTLLCESYELNDFKVVVENLSGIEKYEPIELELNIEPNFKKYIIKREFNKFIKQLPRIKEDNLAINIFKKAYVDDGYFISLLIRNSSASDININTLPMVVTTGNDLIIHESIINFEKGNCVVPSNKAILKNILIPFNEFPLIPGYDGIDFKVFFKNL